MAATVAATAGTVLLLLFVINVVSVVAVAARPLEGDGWLESGIGMVTEAAHLSLSSASLRPHATPPRALSLTTIDIAVLLHEAPTPCPAPAMASLPLSSC
ncbi:hypothetical protein OsJ_22055 [Oryza sativa Japonica Group]|uniref:Uncharacterized protein n=1 Tax=Oryza sativa subsp. japonica TaxID=39947 RepID=B9FQ16_ORYSJ|nr:hypothetical protein OsJ_22055 [Oryza sativa Japonica Group]